MPGWRATHSAWCAKIRRRRRAASGCCVPIPKYVLRNWMAQEAIASAEAGSYALIEELRLLLATPFDEHEEAGALREPPPAGAEEIAVSCSS